MLNVIIVDDDPLLRSGIKHSIDWARYQMSVVGEASSVREAIALLKTDTTINIVFTDMVMPEENGLVLLKWLHINRPDITPVVLSYYSDFALVQDALRLGITDYIIKTELYQDDFHQTMTNISLRAHASSHQTQITTLLWSSYLAALALQKKEDNVENMNESILQSADDYYPISQNSWLLLFTHPIEEEYILRLDQQFQGNWIIVTLDIFNSTISDLIQAVNLYFSRDFFYECLPSLHVYHIDPQKVLGYDGKLTGLEYVNLDREIASIKWMRDASERQQILDKIKTARLSPEAVFNLFYRIQSQWDKYFSKDSLLALTPIVGIKYWYQWIDWINDFLTYASFQENTASYSPEVIRAIRSLILWLDEHFMEDISLSRAAHEANLSPSYLSRSFSDFTGYNFSQYLRNIRINYAKQMLQNSDVSVARVAELCGFQDRFYFDKIFKKEVGISPSMYRHQKETS